MKETLTREEILERSKRENRNGDERERTVRVQGESFSLIFVFLMGLIAWKRFHSLPDEDVLVMFWTSCAASRIYRLTQRRNASDIVTLGISLAFLAYNLVKFLQTTA